MRRFLVNIFRPLPWLWGERPANRWPHLYPILVFMTAPFAMAAFKHQEEWLLLPFVLVVAGGMILWAYFDFVPLRERELYNEEKALSWRTAGKTPFSNITYPFLLSFGGGLILTLFFQAWVKGGIF